MDRRVLKEFLAGRRQLTEMGFNSPGAGASTGLPPLWTGRQERLSQAWTDIVVRLEALALDILDVSEDLYYACLPILKDIRGAASEMVHEQLPRFQGLLSILIQNQALHADMQKHVSRMQQLCQELQYVCDEITPKDPKVPEAPPRRKDDWATGALGAKKPDVTFSAPGAEAQWESTLKQHIKGKGGNEARETPGPHPSCPSLVMASLGSAADSIAESIGDLEANFLRAGDAVRLTLEAYTDVNRADVDVSGCAPGSFPRLEVTARWTGSDKSARCSLYWTENGKERALCVEGIKDDTILMSENLTDAQVASRVYACLDEYLDFRPCAARVGVVPTLYRMIERSMVQPLHVEQVLQGLAARLALSESVQLTPDRVKVQVESISPIIWSWFYTWEHDEDELRLLPPNVYDPDVDGPTHEDPTKGLTERFGAYRSPLVRVNMEAKTVALIGPDGSEEVCRRDMTDEDVTARLLSMSAQKESRTHVVEEWERLFVEEEGFDPKEHPRNLQTGEFVDSGSANAGQRKAAHNAARRAKSKQEWEPTDAEKHPFATKPEDKTEPAKEPGPADKGQAPEQADTTPPEQVPAQEQPQQHPGQTVSVDPFGNTVTQTPPVPDKITQPQPILDPMGNLVGYAPVAPVLPPPATMQQPSKPKKGKEQDFDTPFAQAKPGSESPDLPPPPPDAKALKKIATNKDKVGISTHPQPEEPSDEEKKKAKPQPVIPQPPKGGGVKRHNPDLDAAFGFGPPAGEQQPPQTPQAPPEQQKPGQVTRDNPDLDAIMGVPEAQAVQQVQQDPELQAASQGMEMGSEQDPEVAEVTTAVQELEQEAAQEPEQGQDETPPEEEPQADPAADGAETKPKAKKGKAPAGPSEESVQKVAGAMGKLARKMYARDLVKAKQLLSKDPKFASMSPQERNEAIRAKATEAQERRVAFWSNVKGLAPKLWDKLKSGTKWTWESLLDLSDVEGEQGAKSYTAQL